MQLPKDKPVRLKGKAMGDLRERVYKRDEGKCVWCGHNVILERGHWWSMHLSHERSKGANGPDTEENTRCECLNCHIGIGHGYGPSRTKPVPAKPKKAEDGSWVN